MRNTNDFILSIADNVDDYGKNIHNWGNYTIVSNHRSGGGMTNNGKKRNYNDGEII